MLTDSRSNGKGRIFENISVGVTILQWSKAFDAALGLCPRCWRQEYSQKLPAMRAFAQIRGEVQF